MITGMTTKQKIAVSLDPELVEAARTAVAEGRAASVSAYVEEALRAQAMHDDLEIMLQGMLAETGGPLTDEEKAWADRILGH